ncbi:MAG: helix-turn-helix transcriptional regulator [Oscillospiraceae bacterium]|nr:helix-turn-helix transcriptional regulator [Oscillospiraceae bacterium]
MEIREQLKNIMKSKGITQRELSRMACIPECTISRHMNGYRTGTLYVIQKYAKALGYELVLIPKGETHGYKD